jgi:hypothetical protein
MALAMSNDRVAATISPLQVLRARILRLES